MAVLKDDVERKRPERVEIERTVPDGVSDSDPSRFQPIRIRDFALARFHSGTCSSLQKSASL